MHLSIKVQRNRIVLMMDHWVEGKLDSLLELDCRSRNFTTSIVLTGLLVLSLMSTGLDCRVRNSAHSNRLDNLLDLLVLSLVLSSISLLSCRGRISPHSNSNTSVVVLAALLDSRKESIISAGFAELFKVFPNLCSSEDWKDGTYLSQDSSVEIFPLV